MNEKQVHIINVAIELFSKNGFEGTSMRDLAKAANVNIAMINYYFGSKEKLFETIVESRANMAREVLVGVANDSSLTAMQKVEKMIELQIDKVLAKRHFHKVLQNEVMLNKRPELNEAIGVIFKKNSELYHQVIDGGIASGEFKKVDTNLVISTIYGTINHLFLSRTICSLVFESKSKDPFKDGTIKEKATNYLKLLMRSLLLNQ